MKNIMSVGKISLQNGCCAADQNRTVMSVTGLPALTPVEFVETRSRMRGTGYKDSIYRIYAGRRPTDNALVIHHNSGSPDNLFWDTVEIVPDFFKKRREYGEKCREMSKRYDLPMGACLAVGPENCAALADYLPFARNDYLANEADYAHELFCCGIDRRKRALEALFRGSSTALYIAIQDAGQKNSQRLAELFWSYMAGNLVWNMERRNHRYNLPDAHD